MILNVIDAKYIGSYKIDLKFSNGQQYNVDLEPVLLNEKREIFQQLKDPEYFKKYEIKFNTISWPNEADFAPEFLLETGIKQNMPRIS
jgi:hypothetical protein